MKKKKEIIIIFSVLLITISIIFAIFNTGFKNEYGKIKPFNSEQSIESKNSNPGELLYVNTSYTDIADDYYWIRLLKDFGGYNVTQIYFQDLINNPSLADPYDVLLIGNEIGGGNYYDWNSTEAAAIANIGKPIVARGQGGCEFVFELGLSYTDYTNDIWVTGGAIGQQMLPEKENHTVLKYPYDLPLSFAIDGSYARYSCGFNTSDPFFEIIGYINSIQWNQVNFGHYTGFENNSNILLWAFRGAFRDEYFTLQANQSCINQIEFVYLLKNNEYAPQLLDGKVEPIVGNSTTVFNFTVNYTDADNYSPEYVRLTLNGTTFDMQPLNPLDTNYVDGAIYYFTTLLPVGNYTFYFNASEILFQTGYPQVGKIIGPNVTYTNINPPTLSNGEVIPSQGNTDTYFTFKVNYTDLDNNEPAFINVTIDGLGNFSMSKQDPSDLNFMDGCIYYFNIYLNVGTYNYFFNCSDGVNPASDGPYTGLLVEESLLKNYTMILEYPYDWINATTGVRSSMDSVDDGAEMFNLPFNFTFYNETFDYIYVCTNGFASFTFQTTWDNVQFPTGANPYMIAPFWDDLRAASPCNIFVKNLTSPNRVAIEWQDYYTLGGSLVGTFEIILFESGDIIFNYDYLDYASSYTCGLNFGINQSYFNIYQNLNTSIDNFSILFTRISNDFAPELTDGEVVPISDNSAQLFTFRVNYTDEDNNFPIFVRGVLNNTFIYDMQKEDSNDFNYTDGVIYNFSTYLIEGSYNFTFYSSDGRFEVNSSTYFGPTVTPVNMNPPNLNNGQVDPTEGTELSSYRFIVNYSDPDNNEPTFVNVTIDSQTFEMSKENSTDINYVDGAIYEYSTALGIGNHSFYFNTSDGSTDIGLPLTGNYSGPQVSQYIPPLFIPFHGLSYNWTGVIDSGSQIPWSGTEYYEYLGGNLFSCNETIDMGMPMNDLRTIDNSTRLFISMTGFLWPFNSHDWLWIFNDVSLGEKVYISRFMDTDIEFTVSGETTRDALGFTFDVWILTNPDGDIAYYDKQTGLLIEGTFQFLMTPGWTYSIKVAETNAIKIPDFDIISPQNRSYYHSDVPVIVDKIKDVTTMWFRNSTNGISWSDNYTLTYNGTHFIDDTINWSDGNHIIQIFGTNPFGLINQKTEYFTVDTYGPYVVLESPENKTYFYKDIDIIISNYSQVNKAWFRYKRGGGWSANYTLEYNSTHFINNSISWKDGFYHLQVFANDSTSEVALREEWFVIATKLPLNISHSFADDARPRIALDSSGNVHIVWYGNETGSFEIYYDTNKGGHFGNIQQITSGTNRMWADIAIDSSDIVHLVWMDMVNFENYYTNNTGGQFNPPVSVPGPIAGPFYINAFPSIAVDTLGFAHIAFMGLESMSGDLEIYYTNNTAGTFGTPENVSRNNVWELSPPTIAVDNAGIAHIVYESNFTGNSQIYYKNNSLGDFSMGPVNISRNNAFNTLPDLAIDSIGAVHITWSSNVAGYSEIFYLNNSLNDFTSDPLNISRDSTSNDSYSTIALDKLSTPNSVFITWYKNESNICEIYESDNFLGSFSLPQNISRSHTVDMGSDIAIDPTKKLAHIVWGGNGSDFDIYYYYYPYALELISPKNIIYNYTQIPIIVQNFTNINEVWYRNNTGSGWSNNYTLSWNGTHFNSSVLVWNDGTYQLQIFANTSDNQLIMIEEYFQVDTIPPSNVTDLRDLNSSLSDNIVELAWTPSIDNSEVKYEIWRKLSQEGSWQLIFTTGFNEYQYVDSGLPDGIYEYQVRPIDQAGNYGNFSNIIIVEIKTTSPKEFILIPPTTENQLWPIILIIGIIIGLSTILALVAINRTRKVKPFKKEKIEIPKIRREKGITSEDLEIKKIIRESEKRIKPEKLSYENLKEMIKGPIRFIPEGIYYRVKNLNNISEEEKELLLKDLATIDEKLIERWLKRIEELEE